MPDERRFYLPTLNGWRALSIMGVLAFHACYFYFAKDGIWPNQRSFEGMKHLAFGVNIFFGISGFLIISRLIEEERVFGDVSLREFYIRRGLRIIPPLVVYYLFVFLLDAGGHIPGGLRLGDYLSAIFFVKNYYPDGHWYLAHIWSLSFEEHFYLVWPLLFVAVPRRRLGLVIGVLLAIVAWRTVEYRMNFFARYLYELPPRGRTDLFADYILWGGISAHLYSRPDTREWLRKRFTRYAWPLLLALTVVVKTGVLPVPFKDFILGGLIQLCLLSTVLWPSTWFGRLLESGPMQWVGTLSYSLYLWQQLWLVERPALIPGAAALQTLPGNLMMTFLMAWLSYRYVERPALRWARRLTSRRA